MLSRPAAALLAFAASFAASLVVRVFLEREPTFELDQRLRFVAPVLAGLGCAVVAARFGGSRDVAIQAVLLSATVTLAVCNAETWLFFDQLTLPGIALGGLLCPLLDGRATFDGLYGMLCAGGAALLLLVVSRGGIGVGDVKMLAMIGSFSGPAIQPILVEIVVLLLVGAPVWVFAARRFGSRALADLNDGTEAPVKMAMPTGPAYAGGVFVHLVLGPKLEALVPFLPDGAAWW